MQIEGKSPATGERSPWKPYLAFGTGVAIEIIGDSMEVMVAQVRPSGAHVLSRTTIAGFRHNPAAQWAREYQEAAKGHEPGGVTVLLPRREVIVRYLALPGVSAREMQSALALRLRALHPFAEDDVAWCWIPTRNGALVGLIRLSVLSRYEELFAEAGIPVTGFTFSASVIHSALRLYGQPPQPLLATCETEPGRFEVYGENESGVIYSGEFPDANRAVAVAVAELRLSPEFRPIELRQVTPGDVAGDQRPLLLCAAIANACPLFVRPANFLPPERRAARSRIWLIPSIVLGALLLFAVIALFAAGPYQERQYRQALQDEISKFEPLARRATTLDHRIAQTRNRTVLLDNIRGRAQADFEILNELTRIIAPPAWLSQVEIYPDSVVIAGEAEQAAPLLQMLDRSPLFQNSEFSGSVSRSAKDEVFRIRSMRRVVK
jgi:Tfp pilus assembly protein PilN